MKLLQLFVITVAIGFVSCQKNSNPTPNPTHNPPPATTLNIVILGSSSAAGDGANPIDSSWARRLPATVNKDQVKANFTNLAFGGYTTYEAMPTGYHAASRPAPDTARNITKALSYKPALVMLSFPTNDIAANYSDDEILANYAKITHVLDSAKVKYIIFSTQPRDFATATQRLRLKTLNDKIISAYTIHVNDFLDQLSNADYTIKTIYSAGDGIHVNNAGHAVIYTATMKQPIFTQLLGLK